MVVIPNFSVKIAEMADPFASSNKIKIIVQNISSTVIHDHYSHWNIDCEILLNTNFLNWFLLDPVTPSVRR